MRFFLAIILLGTCVAQEPPLPADYFLYNRQARPAETSCEANNRYLEARNRDLERQLADLTAVVRYYSALPQPVQPVRPIIVPTYQPPPVQPQTGINCITYSTGNGTSQISCY